MDWNNDGMLDLIIGEWHGYVNYYRRTGSGIHDLTFEERLTDDNGVIKCGYSTPVVVDWNDDGLKDLLVAHSYYQTSSPYGRIRLYINSGSDSAPHFTTYTYVQNSGSDLYLQSCRPKVFDLNCDGKKDIIAGAEAGHVVYFENIGTNSAPVFNGSVRLSGGGSLIKIRRASRLCIADWDEDGNADIVLGEHDGYLTLFLAATTSISDNQSEPESSQFTVEPAVNPVTDYFSLKLSSSSEPVSIAIYDSMGRMAKSLTLSGQSDIAVISAESLAVGVYTVVATHDGSMSSCRVVVTR